MSGRILVHIGLPKTATTTLQTQYFPTLTSGNSRYLGVLQPRERRQDELFRKLSNAVTVGLDIEGIHQELSRLLEAGVNIVVSEEMFTVSSSGGASWQMKLQRLASLLRGLDYAIMVTVREPVAGSFSYYVELESRYRPLGLGYVAAVKTDEAMQIFDYGKLLPALDGCFAPGRVFFKRFEDVIAGRMEDVDHRLAMKRQIAGVAMKTMNSKRSTGGRVFTGRQQTLADALRATGLIRGVRQILGQGRAFRVMRAILRWFDAIPLSERSVELPTRGEREEVAGLLGPGWRDLQGRMSSHV